jgi:hypothetical protein
VCAGWDNVIDHYGFTFLFAENDLAQPTDKLANDTTSFNLRRPAGCKGSTCLRAGFFPHDQFPRFGSWPHLRDGAIIHHIVGGDAALGPQHEHPVGIKPSRG